MYIYIQFLRLNLILKCYLFSKQHDGIGLVWREANLDPNAYSMVSTLYIGYFLSVAAKPVQKSLKKGGVYFGSQLMV